jgi:hypothetical protein
VGAADRVTMRNYVNGERTIAAAALDASRCDARRARGAARGSHEGSGRREPDRPQVAPLILGIHVVVGHSFRDKMGNAQRAVIESRTRLINAILVRARRDIPIDANLPTRYVRMVDARIMRMAACNPQAAQRPVNLSLNADLVCHCGSHHPSRRSRHIGGRPP